MKNKPQQYLLIASQIHACHNLVVKLQNDSDVNLFLGFHTTSCYTYPFSLCNTAEYFKKLFSKHLFHQQYSYSTLRLHSQLDANHPA